MGGRDGAGACGHYCWQRARHLWRRAALQARAAVAHKERKAVTAKRRRISFGGGLQWQQPAPGRSSCLEHSLWMKQEGGCHLESVLTTVTGQPALPGERIPGIGRVNGCTRHGETQSSLLTHLRSDGQNIKIDEKCNAEHNCKLQKRHRKYLFVRLSRSPPKPFEKSCTGVASCQPRQRQRHPCHCRLAVHIHDINSPLEYFVPATKSQQR